METLRVIFRREKNGDILAVFPDEPGRYDPATCMCYAHIGQHGCVHMDYVLRNTKPALAGSYDTLLRELQGIYEQGEEAVKLIPSTNWQTARTDFLRRKNVLGTRES